MPKPGRNFVGEWFGHRVYPKVAEVPEALRDQRDGRCPFLSSALAEDKRVHPVFVAGAVLTVYGKPGIGG